jgi:GTP cyclohydrolase II
VERAGVRVVERVPCQPESVEAATRYLTTKKEKLGHLLEGF